MPSWLEWLPVYITGVICYYAGRKLAIFGNSSPPRSRRRLLTVAMLWPLVPVGAALAAADRHIKTHYERRPQGMESMMTENK